MIFALVARIRGSDVVRHGFVVFVAMLSANALTYIFYAGSARTLGVVSSGALNSLLSAMLLFSVPTNAGATVVAATTAAARARGDLSACNRIARRVNVVGTAAGIALAVTAIFAAAPIQAYFHLATVRTVVLAAFGFAFTFVLPLQRGTLQGAGAFGRFAASNLVEAVPKATLGISWGMSTLGLDGALAGYTAAVGIAYAYNAWAMSKTDNNPGVQATMQTARKPFQTLLILVPVGALTVMTFYDVVLVKHAFSGRDAGLYGAASLVGRALITVIAFVPAVLLPKAAERIQRDRAAALRLLGMALAVSGLIVVTALGVCAAAPARVVTLVAGVAFADSAPYVLPYALAMGWLAGASVLASFLIGARLLRFALPLALVAGVEIAMVALYHRSISDVLHSIELGHFGAFAVTAIAVALWARKKNGAGCGTPQ